MLKTDIFIFFLLEFSYLFPQILKGQGCSPWSRAYSVYVAQNQKFTCETELSEYMICAASENVKLRLILFILRESDGNTTSLPRSLYYNDNLKINRKKVQQFGNKFIAYPPIAVHPGDTLGAIVKVTDGQVNDIEHCHIQLWITNTTTHSCDMSEGPYIVQKADHDCFHPVESSLIYTSQQLPTSQTTFPQETSELTTNLSWTAAVVLAVFLITETTLCGVLWVMCLKYPRLYKSASKFKSHTLTRNDASVFYHDSSVVLDNEETLQPQNGNYHTILNSDYSDCEDKSYSNSYSAPTVTVTSLSTNTLVQQSKVNCCGHYEMEEHETEHINKNMGIYEMEDDANYWYPMGTADDIYSEMKNKQYPLIQQSDIKLTKVIGKGEFGQVHKGIWTTNNKPMTVAVKELKESACEEERVKLLKEAAIMGQFTHYHVVMLLGVVNDSKKVLLVMEYLPRGDLQQCLLKQGHSEHLLQESQLPEQLLLFCTHIADAMAYLSGRGFIHRDLAARNILLDEHLQCKIADFGMSCDLQDDYYYKPKGGCIPVKWTAPEAILYRKYSTKSDVWSYGMVMYEIWSLGHKPFEEFAIEEVLKTLDKGYCQPPPPGCPPGVYQIMVNCWNPNAHLRPNFQAILESLQKDKHSLLDWKDADMMGSEAATLGAPLQYGASLYPDLQKRYKD